MKLIVGVILSLALLELFYCAPLIGSDDGTYTETHTSSSWGYNAGVDANVGLEGGYKDGIGSLGLKNHLGGNVGGFKENGQSDLKHPVTAAPPPNNFTPGYGSSYGMPTYPANGSPYNFQFAPQPAQQNLPLVVPQFTQQPLQQYPPQQVPQGAPQYQYAPQQVPQGAPQYQYAPQQMPQGAPQYQYAPQQVPQGAPQYQYAPQQVPQGAPQYQYAPQQVPQGAPQYQYAPQQVPQGAPQYQYAPQQVPQVAPPNGYPNSSQRPTNEEAVH